MSGFRPQVRLDLLVDVSFMEAALGDKTAKLVLSCERGSCVQRWIRFQEPVTVMAPKRVPGIVPVPKCAVATVWNYRVHADDRSSVEISSAINPFGPGLPYAYVPDDYLVVSVDLKSVK